MSATVNKDEVRRILDQLPDNATWEDLIHKLYVVECIEQGLTDSQADRVAEAADVRAKYGLPR